MLRIAALSLSLLIACGGSSPPPAEEAPVTAPPEAYVPPDAGPGPDPVYQEALLCEQDCEMNTDGDYDTVEAGCREQCGLPPRD